VDYVHWNPVKHRLVTSVRDWPHSTFHRYVARGWLPLDWAGSGHSFGDFGE
jgi:putative transposase